MFAGEILQHRGDLRLAHGLLVHPFAHDLLLGAHLPYELIDALGELAHRFIVAAGSSLGTGAVRLLQPVGQGRERALHVEHGAVELAAHLVRAGRRGAACRRQFGDARQPFLQLVVEAVVCMARLQIEKAEDERSGKAEEGGGEGGAHALQRCGEPVLQLLEHHHAVAGLGIERVDGRADRLHGLEQAPECAEQARGRRADRRGSGRCRAPRPGDRRSNP